MQDCVLPQAGIPDVSVARPRETGHGRNVTPDPYREIMSDDTLFPGEIPRAVAPYLVTVTMTRPPDGSALVPPGGLVLPGGHAAVELAAVLVSARDVITRLDGAQDRGVHDPGRHLPGSCREKDGRSREPSAQGREPRCSLPPNSFPSSDKPRCLNPTPVGLPWANVLLCKASCRSSSRHNGSNRTCAPV